MNPSVPELEAQRARWVRYRDSHGLVPAAGGGLERGGLARHAVDLDVRVMFLPGDPEAAAVSFDSDVLAWLGDRPSPYGGAPVHRGYDERATSEALVRCDQSSGERGWTRYLALHRHGGVETGVTNYADDVQKRRVFHLRPTVGLVWTVAALQTEAIAKWTIPGPFEFVLALTNTKGGTLGSFAEGWTEFGEGVWDPLPCLEDFVLLRWELGSDFESEVLALEAGDRLEQSFGTVQRRHLAGRGEYAGQFDPRFRS